MILTEIEKRSSKDAEMRINAYMVRVKKNRAKTGKGASRV